MKAIKTIISLIAIICMVSCGGGITPTKVKIQGPLGEYFEIVSKEYKPKDNKVSIEIKRIKEGFPSPWNSGMDIGTTDGKFEPCFSIEFQDADGNVVSKDKTNFIVNRDELSALAALNVDESSTISFDVDNDATQFKMSSTFTTHGEMEQNLSLEGGIGQYGIVMTMHISPNGKVTGAYYYTRMGRGHYMYIKGEKDKDIITINEFDKNGKNTGKFVGKLTNGTYSGHFSAESGEYEFLLKPSEIEVIDLNDIDFDSFVEGYTSYDDSDSSSEEYSSDSGDGDWDSLLDSYDSFVSQYITLYKKASKGDMSALAEYPGYMEKAQELSNRLSAAQGEMSSTQVARYLKITSRLSRAAF